MIVGSVNSDTEAIVQLLVRGPLGKVADVDAILDTRFNDWVTLSRTQVEELGLPFREEGRYVLADGSEAVSRIFTAEAKWLGRWRRILVIELDGGPLLGMALLRGSHLGIDVTDGGRVEIRSLKK